MVESLAGYSIEQLDNLYLQAKASPIPTGGSYSGRFIRWLSNAGAHTPFFRLPESLFFEHTPFGLSFYADHGEWFFYHPSVAAGKFTCSQGPSRWRSTESIRLTYEESSLFFKNLLYDELKALDGEGRVYLGMGGLNFDRNFGDHFYFYLQRQELHD